MESQLPGAGSLLAPECGQGAEHFATNEGSRVHVVPLQEQVTQSARERIVLLFVAVGFLLLIACINVANLVLARATGRRQEMALRASLGAGWGRILRLLLTETVILWMLGGILGVILAWGGRETLTGLWVGELPPVFRLASDLRVAGVALGLSLLTGLVFGLAAALRVVRQDPREFLKEGRRRTGGPGGARFRTGLVVAEVGLAVALLVGTGLTLRSFSRILDASPGLDPANLLTVDVKLPSARYPDTPERTAFFTALLDGVRALPGVASAATGKVVPLAPGGWQNAFHAEGAPPEEGGLYTYAEASSISTGYFRTLGIPLPQGRDFTRQDNDASYSLLVKSRGNPLALVEPLRRIVLGLDPSLPLTNVETMEAYQRQTTRSPRLLGLLMAVFEFDQSLSGDFDD